MGRGNETFGKKEVRNKKEKKRKEKEKRRLERKEQGKSSFEDMIAYVDANGNLVDTPPDLSEKEEIELEDIEISVAKKEDREEDSLRQGIVNNFDENKGFGFITDSESRDSLFVHINDCEEEIKRGMKVVYEMQKDPKGFKAIKVKVSK